MPCKGVGGHERNQTWGHSPYHNHAQTTPHQGGQYCKKSYAGGDNNIERTQGNRATPSSPLVSVNTLSIHM